MGDKEKVSKREKEIIERKKVNGEIEKVSGIREDMEKLWADAKDDAEMELFRWGSVKEEMPKVWDLIKRHQAYQLYQASKVTGDYKWNKSELYELNNLASLRYAQRIEKYLLSSKAGEDKKRVNRDGINRFEERINHEWKDAKDYISRKMAKQIKNK